MAFIDDIKQRLRISHNKLNDDLTATVAAARAELVRVGVDSTLAASESDPLIVEAIKTYCQYGFTDDEKAREGYWNSWVTQVDGLRKSSGYMRDRDAE